MRVLAFEDGADILLLLAEGAVEVHDLVFEQRWDSSKHIDVIRAFAPDVLLLDHYMPPTRGLDVLRAVNAAVSAADLTRPATIIAMSSLEAANDKMLEHGADAGIVKSRLATLQLWPRLHSS